MTADIIPIRARPFGATPEEWAHFELLVGAADLLPVVSRPGAIISPRSTLKALGKTPSTYNGQREVIGIPKWTQLTASAADIERWSRNPDHGLCIQTRRVRALDIDVPDPDLADRIEAAFLVALGGVALPARVRANTGKRLLAFELVGQFPKRSFKVDGGLVEFLANGQQFIAIGEHFDGTGQPSGTRYEWLGGLPNGIPQLRQEAVELAWLGIVEEFALEPAAEGAEGSDRTRADLQGVADPVADYLEDQGLVLGAQGEKLFVTCPWKDGHTGDSGISQTAWLVAGTKGFEQGHFQCMHASCAKRADVDFLDAIGFRAAAFTDLTQAGEPSRPGEDDGGAEPSGAVADDLYLQPWPKFKRTANGNQIEAALGNVVMALERPDICGLDVAFDTFRDEFMVREGSGPNSYLRAFEDADAVTVRMELEKRGFKAVGRELMRDALMKHGRNHRFDSAQDWLTGLPAWDGVERVATMFPRLFSIDDTPYTRAVGLYVWTALAGRIMDPGCKVDMVPILQGSQGQQKSAAVKALAPSPEMFKELNLHNLDADLSRKLRGCVVGEMAELRGLKTRDAESIKAWIVQQHEHWVPKWQERETSFPRRLLLFGTANPTELLDDETGERRWLPMAVKGHIDLAGLVAEREQLWAEGLLRWRIDGIAWQAAERLARAEHANFKVRDAWTDRIAGWLDQPLDVSGVTPNQRGWVQLWDVASCAVSLDARSLTRPVELRIGKCLRALGWSAGNVRVGDEVLWAWRKG